jgi:hypothetical protein
LLCLFFAMVTQAMPGVKGAGGHFFLVGWLAVLVPLKA